jgi:hypothetical protein
MSREYVSSKRAIALADTFRFDKIGGDKALLMRAWGALKGYGEDPLGRDMLMLRDVAGAINRRRAKTCRA